MIFHIRGEDTHRVSENQKNANHMTACEQLINKASATSNDICLHLVIVNTSVKQTVITLKQ